MEINEKLLKEQETFKPKKCFEILN